MPLSRPTLQEIKNRHETDIRAELGSGPFLDGSFLKAKSNANAGAIHGIYGYGETLSREALPNNAVSDFLNGWASTFGVSRIAATYAEGDCIFTGNNGVTIPAGSQLIGDNDISYITTALGIIADGTVTIHVVALAPGVIGNMAAAQTISLLLPIAGVNSTVTVGENGLIDGSDQETDQSLRERVNQRIQAPPHGGNYDDYERWALSIAGIGKVWVLPLINGAGTVGIYVVSNDENNLIPAEEKVQEVFDYIVARNRKPVTAKVTVNAPDPVDQDFEINISPDSPEVRAAVEASLIDLLRRERKPGVLQPNNTVAGYTLPISKIREAVSTAAGENDNTVVSPAADVTFEVGEIPVFGEIDWGDS